MLQKFAAALANRLAELLAPVIERKLDEYGPVLAEKMLALLPVIAATVAKTIAEQVLARMPDVDIPVVSDIFDLTETIRGNVNQSIPDLDLPIISDYFDLTELFNQRRPQ